MFKKELLNYKVDVLRKPFLRWTGGKNWLVNHFLELASKIDFNNYHEPFLGGGSIFFSLNTNKKAYLSDYNWELINTYKQVRDNPTRIINYLKNFPHNKEFYYEIRDEIIKSDIKKAARFIYLNKTSFNGIYRVNLEGKYNVPYGNRTFNLNIINHVIYSCSEQLKNTKLYNMDFMESIAKVEENDLIYLDPPYTITHNNNGFVRYNEKLFSIVDQFRLAELIKEIKEKGAYYILSNAHHPDVKKIYDKFEDNVLTLSRMSLISGTASGRDLYKEYIFTNIF